MSEVGVMTEESEPFPLSALQHAVYCLRQAALIHIERAWADNRYTAEGHVLHAVADKGGSRKARGVRRVMTLPLSCKRLGLPARPTLSSSTRARMAARRLIPSNTSAASRSCIAPTKCSFSRRRCAWRR